MATLRNSWSFPARNARRRASPGPPPSRARWGTSALRRSEEAATFRWCISSPMARAWAISGRRSTPPAARKAVPRSGPASSRSQASRARTVASCAPNRRTRPRPSLIVAAARVPKPRVSTMRTGIDAVTRPVIGPTAPRWWHGSKRTRQRRRGRPPRHPRRPAFVPERPHHRTPERRAHPDPADRRPRVKDGVRLQSEGLPGRRAVDEDRLRLAEPAKDLRVGRPRAHGPHHPAAPYHGQCRRAAAKGPRSPDPLTSPGALRPRRPRLSQPRLGQVRHRRAPVVWTTARRPPPAPERPLGPR
jgi:hypothetical protein